MKLSEAIRLGAMIRPQGFAALNKDGRTCALGAAGEAVGIMDIDDDYAVLKELWPLLNTENRNCPECTDTRLIQKSCDVIWHLNDQHHWSRERIADWVSTLESQQEVREVEGVEVGKL